MSEMAGWEREWREQLCRESEAAKQPPEKTAVPIQIIPQCAYHVKRLGPVLCIVDPTATDHEALVAIVSNGLAASDRAEVLAASPRLVTLLAAVSSELAAILSPDDHDLGCACTACEVLREARPLVTSLERLRTRS
jgi:hypothetical protein